MSKASVIVAVSKASAIVAASAACVIVAMPALAAPAQARTPANARAPTAAQIHKAVRRAEQSRNLWATVNICDTSRHANMLGVRGQMPALGFRSRAKMSFQVQYWAAAKHRFLADRGATGRVSLGPITRGLHQAGYQFQFAPPALVRAQVTFVWKLHGKVIGDARRITSAGHRRADFGDPRGYSAARCRIS